MKNLIVPLTLSIAALVAGCDSGGVERQLNTAVRVVHAAPTLPTVAFLREQREESQITYGAGDAFSFEADQYDFNVQVADIATGQPVQLLSFSETLVEATDYLFVLLETGGSLGHITVATPHFDGTSGDAEVAAVHAAPTQAPFDVYLTVPGTDLTGAVPLGSIAYTASLDPSTIAPGDYRLSVTAAGVPATPLFQDTLTVAAGESYTFVVTEGESPSLAALNVVNVNDAPVRLADENAQSSLRVIHAVSDRLARDIVLDDDFTTPFIAGLPFATAPAHQLVAPGQHAFSVTPAGNPSVEELEATLALAAGREYTALVTGDGTTLAETSTFEDRRPIANQGKLRLFNGISGTGQVQFFIVPPGTDLANASPAYFSTAPAMSQAFGVPPGSYEVSLFDSTTEAVIAGPTPITIAGGGIYGVLGVDAAAGGGAGEIVLIDDF
jgi:hypothetical protein